MPNGNFVPSAKQDKAVECVDLGELLRHKLCISVDFGYRYFERFINLHVRKNSVTSLM